MVAAAGAAVAVSLRLQSIAQCPCCLSHWSFCNVDASGRYWAIGVSNGRPQYKTRDKTSANQLHHHEKRQTLQAGRQVHCCGSVQWTLPASSLFFFFCNDDDAREFPSFFYNTLYCPPIDKSFQLLLQVLLSLLIPRRFHDIGGDIENPSFAT